MNSDLDDNSEALISQLLTWLSQDSLPKSALSADWETETIDPLDSEEVNVPYSSTDKAMTTSQPTTGGFDPKDTAASPSGAMFMMGFNGEIPIVQNRFQALMKRRLQEEIELHLPLFPWERQFTAYDAEVTSPVADAGFQLWIPQLNSLNLPTSLPERVLTQLLAACTQAVQAPLQLGAKMVHAVESLFPTESESSLNQLAGLVLLELTRGEKPDPVLNYEAATAEQQMALSLLAAREIINALTLSVTPTSKLKRQWQTTAGELSLQAEYKIRKQVSPKMSPLGTLKVQSRLPRGGSLTLATELASASASRTYSGYLSVESFDVQPNQTYSLEIRLPDFDREPLIFAIEVKNSDR